MPKMRLQPELLPGPAGGAYSAPAGALAGFKGPNSNGRGGQGRSGRGEGKGKKGGGKGLIGTSFSPLRALVTSDISDSLV